MKVLDWSGPIGLSEDTCWQATKRLFRSLAVHKDRLGHYGRGTYVSVEDGSSSSLHAQSTPSLSSRLGGGEVVRA